MQQQSKTHGYLSPKLSVGISPTLGIRGILSVGEISAGELIESSPVVLMTAEELVHIEPTVLKYYYYEWKEILGALVVGYGMIYNHSYDSNAYFECDYDGQMMNFLACKRIPKGEEVTINYNGPPDDTTPIDPGYLRPLRAVSLRIGNNC